MNRLKSQQIEFKKSFAIACLGKGYEVVNGIILPETFTKDNVYFGLNPKVYMYEDLEIGKIRPFFKSNSHQGITFLIDVDPSYNLSDIYHCEFKLNTLFSSKIGNFNKIDSVIIESIYVKQKINQAT